MWYSKPSAVTAGSEMITMASAALRPEGRRLCVPWPGQGIAGTGIARAGVVLSRRLACCRREAARRPMPGLYGAACP
jgi:hypothetical protein